MNDTNCDKPNRLKICNNSFSGRETPNKELKVTEVRSRNKQSETSYSQLRRSFTGNDKKGTGVGVNSNFSIFCDAVENIVRIANTIEND